MRSLTYILGIFGLVTAITLLIYGIFRIGTAHPVPKRELWALPDPDYSCGADFCDDPACKIHGDQNDTRS